MRNKVYFISDLHLGAAYIADHKAHERAIVEWLRSIAPSAAELYLVGDVLDYWYEYRTVVPRGHTRFFGALAALADSGVKITWLKGNHDIWIYDYLPAEIGMAVIDGPLVTEILGKRFYIEHGDASGENRPSYRRLRALFRNRLAQRLFSAIHPRWTVPFAHRWSSHSRCNAADWKFTTDHRLYRFAVDYLANVDPGIDYFLFGHLHIVEQLPVGSHSEFIVLGDAFSSMTYAVFDGESLQIKKIV